MLFLEKKTFFPFKVLNQVILIPILFNAPTFPITRFPQGTRADCFLPGGQIDTLLLRQRPLTGGVTAPSLC